MNKQKEIKWQPEHFPGGTVVILGNYEKVGNEFHYSSKNDGAEVTVTECVNNGPDNWLIRTDAWNESLEHFHAFNFNHVTRIKSRGNGLVKFHKHPNSIKGMPNFKVMITNDPLNKNRYYYYYYPDIVKYLIRETGFVNNLYIKEGFFDFFFKQTFVRKTGKGWSALTDFDKKRAKRFVRQNINRWIKPMKEVRSEETIRRKQETDEHYRDMEDDWDRDFDARHPELIEEPVPVPANHFYGSVDMDIKDNFNTYHPVVIDNPFITEKQINKAIRTESIKE